MKIGLASRHCDACQKEVRDFTNSTKEEIITYLLQNRDKRVCGHFRQNQLDYHHRETELLIEGALNMKGNLAFAILSLTCMTFLAQPASANESQLPEHFVPTVASQTWETEKDTLKKKNCHQKPDSTHKSEEIIFLDGDVEIVGKIIVDTPIEELNETSDTVLAKKEPIFVIVEEMPEFPGGMEAFQAFVKKHLRYPEWEKENGIQGVEYVSIIIGKDGKVHSPKILRSVPGSRNFDEEVLRLIELMPDWKPGKQRGKTVQVQYNLPIRFKL